MNKKNIFILGSILFLISFLLRVYRIDQLATFLGDQGRSGIVILNTISNHSIPLSGPTTLSGQHLGPFFYYLIFIPFALVPYNPLIVSIFMAILGAFTVVLLYILLSYFFPRGISFFVALIYTCSPHLIAESREIWEPSPIPFFTILYLIFLYLFYSKKKYRYLISSSVLLGILAQLHYPDLILGLPLIFVIIAVWRTERKLFKITVFTFVGFFSFLVILLPFIIFELKNGFEDIRGLLYTLFVAPPQVDIYRPFYINSIDYSTRLFKYVLPFKNMWLVFGLELSMILYSFKKTSTWHKFIVVWFALGLLAISRYKGVVFDHYLNFLVPFPFIITAYFINSFKSKDMRVACFIGCVIVSLIFISMSDIFLPGKGDMFRTRAAVENIIYQANNKPFSFTIIQSDSFSDLHYRYFFKLYNIQPLVISSTKYDTLFLVCEKGLCPTSKELLSQKRIQSMCNEDHCWGEYPVIDLSFWKLTRIHKKNSYTVYTLTRK